MLRVNLIAWDNGVGLSRDLRLIADVLRDAGISVDIQPGRGRGKLRKWFGPWLRRARIAFQRTLRRPRYDLNLMLEHIHPELLGAARHNAFIPNPEWCLPRDVKRLPRMDHVFAKTRHAVDIFDRRGCRAAPIGFTSVDRHDAQVPRRRTFFHLAGRSGAKRTRLVLETWARHPEWPTLTVVQHPRTAHFSPSAPNIVHRIDYVDDAELRRLQNENLFHLCPSETEGFGHYLVEALSVGAIALTTDAEPMNELVTAQHGILIPFSHTGRQELATRYLIETVELEAAVEAALALDDREIARRSLAARDFYKRNDAAFRSQLVQVVRMACQGVPSASVIASQATDAAVKDPAMLAGTA
ncbi:glycosyltransferase [Pseudoxanthomonas putridarboris]|uniref:Glycosyltransferase n=1 Tax=Pseudoxanthomonas putridarboris TaxID=752605 RepID=A0ABU9IVU7_9GAMM